MITKPKDIGLMSAFTGLLIVIKKTQQAEKSAIEALQHSQCAINTLQIQNNLTRDRVEEVMQLVNQRCDRVEQKLQEDINDFPNHQVIELHNLSKPKTKQVTFTEEELENILVTLVADLCAKKKNTSISLCVLGTHFYRIYDQSLSSVLKQLKLGKYCINFLKKRPNKFHVTYRDGASFVSLVHSVKDLTENNTLVKVA
ncbi:hypothetical protein [Gloeocapsa sp. PCC 7428]|uniref:hypothetical protein n=1 Tax=Gloeocapsa sp. PCC 7428 TaxID=1173026 RepID=UPI0030D79E51